MKRHRYIVIAGLTWLIFTSCNRWLEVEPSNTVDDKKLFSDYNGFRNSLNGIYQNLSEQSLYGKELSWGLASCLSQTYLEGRSFMNTKYEAYQSYDYEDNMVKAMISDIWLNSYRVIANCNKLIEETEKKNASFFPNGKLERNLILGEALALRGAVHFDLLRLFAPAPVLKDEGTYIPYFSVYPSKFERKESVKTILDRVIADLTRAGDLIAENDTVANSVVLELVNGRLAGAVSAKQGGRFFAFRGIRMNYVAVRGMLARVYLYAGDHENARLHARYIYDRFGPKSARKWFQFTPKQTAAIEKNDSKSVKFWDDILFAYYDRDLLEKIVEFSNSGVKMILADVDNLYAGVNKDWRVNLVTREQEDNGYSRSVKWMDTKSKTSLINSQYPLIPALRLSEVYYILSESLWTVDKTEAIKVLNEVRRARGASWDIAASADEETYLKELVNDARKEFMAEGQMFYMYKRLNRPVLKDISSVVLGAKFVLPAPVNENIY